MPLYNLKSVVFQDDLSPEVLSELVALLPGAFRSGNVSPRSRVSMMRDTGMNLDIGNELAFRLFGRNFQNQQVDAGGVESPPPSPAHGNHGDLYHGLEDEHIPADIALQQIRQLRRELEALREGLPNEEDQDPLQEQRIPLSVEQLNQAASILDQQLPQFPFAPGASDGTEFFEAFNTMFHMDVVGPQTKGLGAVEAILPEALIDRLCPVIQPSDIPSKEPMREPSLYSKNRLLASRRRAAIFILRFMYQHDRGAFRSLVNDPAQERAFSEALVALDWALIREELDDATMAMLKSAGVHQDLLQGVRRGPPTSRTKAFVAQLHSEQTRQKLDLGRAPPKSSAKAPKKKISYKKKSSGGGGSRKSDATASKLDAISASLEKLVSSLDGGRGGAKGGYAGKKTG